MNREDEGMMNIEEERKDSLRSLNVEPKKVLFGSPYNL